MQTLSEIRSLLAARGLHPRKRFGQNFLHDQNQLRRLVGAAGVEPGDVVLEVGPGTGTLTEALLDAGAEVIAAEIDRDLGDLIEDRLGNRITLVRGDALDGRRLASPILDALGDRPFRLVANLPYQAASPIMASLVLDHAATCRGQYVTIQREVADRLVARPGTKAYGPLGIIMQAFSTVERIAVLPASCFWPAPQVTSAMVGIRPKEACAIDDRPAFARFVTTLFTKRRKQLGTILGAENVPEDVDPKTRPDALDIDTIIRLSRIQRDD